MYRSSLEQDRGLEAISEALRRQREMGLAMTREVEGHFGEPVVLIGSFVLYNNVQCLFYRYY